MGVKVVDRLPPQTTELWTTLAGGMPKLERVRWDAGNWQTEGEAGWKGDQGVVRWKVEREGGVVRLSDDETSFESLRTSHTGSLKNLFFIVNGKYP